ncbi:MAG: 2-oxoacid:acceptor oxidoreductase family protein [Candidatus Hydrothermarchaeota archaeon]
MQKREVRFSGIGGQGIVLMALLYARGASLKGLNVSQTPSYGAEKRGTFSQADVIISENEIVYPKARGLDLYVSMHQEKFDENLRFLKKEGVLFVDEDLVFTEKNAYKVPSTKLAHKIGNKMVANVIMLGALSVIDNIVDERVLKKAINDTLPEAFIDVNIQALKEGIKYADEFLRR